MKAVIFDIDDTMYDFKGTHAVAMKALSEYCTSFFSIDEKQFQETYLKAQKIVTGRTVIDCAANHNRLLRFQCMLELLKVQQSSHALKMYHVYWDTLIDAMKPEPGLAKLFEVLRSRSILTGVGTDMTAYIQYKKLEKLGLLDQLSHIITSEETGVEKPSPHFFQVCVEKMGCKPEECVFIGDSLRKDVKGAIESGLHGVWYRPHGEISPKERKYPVIRSFEDCVKGNQIVFGDKLVIE